MASVLAQALHPKEASGNLELIYISPELVADIKDCKYSLGWNTSYHNCHWGLSPFAVPYMSKKDQQEQSEYQECLGKVTTTLMENVAKGESNPSPPP
jgi:hypothetical protein